MGRELKRVPLDFNWPLNKVWKGYICPYKLKECSYCGGGGYSPEYKIFEEEFYGFHNPKYVDLPNGRRMNINATCNKITQGELDYFWDHHYRLKRDYKEKPSLEQFNKDMEELFRPLDAYEICKHRCEVIGARSSCKICKGRGYLRTPLWNYLKYKLWHSHEPPKGKGFQLWETTSEGSPISPVFTSLEELCRWAAENETTFAHYKATKEEWMKMLDHKFIYHQEGNMIFM